jgi:hypothetical protein
VPLANGAIRNQWTGSIGLATTNQDSPIEAIRFATEMLGKGYGDVVIVDLQQGGKAYTPGAFATFLQRSQEVTALPEGSRRQATEKSELHERCEPTIY